MHIKILTATLLFTVLSVSYFFAPSSTALANPAREQLGAISISGQNLGSANNINVFINAIVNFAIGSGVVVFFIMGSWASWQWLTAGNDPKAVAAARARLTSAAIGLILLACTFAAFAIIQVLTPLGDTAGTAIPAGAYNGPCRPTGPQCDAGLVCNNGGAYNGLCR